MTRAVKAVTTYRGRDPRDFVLVRLRRQRPGRRRPRSRARCSMPHVLVPAGARRVQRRSACCSPTSSTSSRGRCSCAARRRSTRGARARLPRRSRRRRAPSSRDEGIDHDDVHVRAARRPALRRPGLRADRAACRRGPSTSSGSSRASHAEHERTYGHGRRDDPVDLVRTCACSRACRERPRHVRRARSRGRRTAPARPRRPTSAPSAGLVDTPVDRAAPTSPDGRRRAADRRGVRRDLRRPAGLPARRSTRSATSRSMSAEPHGSTEPAHRPDHARGDQERARVDRRRDGAGGDAQRLLAGRARHHGLLDRALRPARPGRSRRG